MANGDANWEDAERQIRAAGGKGGKITTVSVKSNHSGAISKRKAGEAVAEAHKELESFSGRPKKSKKGR